MKRYFIIEVGFWISDRYVDADKTARSILARVCQEVSTLNGDIDSAEIERAPLMDKEEGKS